MALTTGCAAVPPKCLGCLQFITDISKQRKLGSRATKQVIPVFKDLLERKYPGFQLETRLEGDDSYLCVPCFQRLEGVMRLRRQLADKEMKVEEHLDKSIAAGALTLVEVRVPVTSPLSTPPLTSQGSSSPRGTPRGTPRGGGRRRGTHTRDTTGRRRRTSLSLVCCSNLNLKL